MVLRALPYVAAFALASTALLVLLMVGLMLMAVMKVSDAIE